ncbi:MAG: TatD family hydrolase [Candidatus Paceibacterota bacterium]|jgi:TatD DNase family protein
MEYKFVDNHAHLNFNAFKDDLPEVLQRAKDADVLVVNVGTQQDTSVRAVEIAEQNDGVYAIVGLHPVHTGKSFHDEKEIGEGGQEFTSRGEIFDYNFYKKLALNPKVVGIGECGLDYYRLEEDTKAVQKKAFEDQIRLSLETGKPLMLHIREAYEDSIEILKAHNVCKANVHFFAGSKEIAKQFLDLGCTLSFTGVITFAKDYEELVAYTPFDRILSETDCPYVAPKPYRGKRNEPAYVVEVVRKVAEIKKVSFEEAAEKLLKNSKVLFGI